MINKTYKLREEFPVLAKKDIPTLKKECKEYMKKTGNDANSWATYHEPTLTAYCPDVSIEIDPKIKRPTIVICPGGGYIMCSDRESEPIALAFTSRGFNCFVLRYETAPVKYPAQLLEVSAAFAFIRRNAEEFHIDTEKIAVCGFSAGGHLAASLGVFWDEPFIRETLGLKENENKPNAMILGYPVITSGTKADRGSFESLLGKDAPKELIEKMSLEKQVSKKTPPAFIWQTWEDDCVPVENSMLFAKALKKEEIPFELHIFEWGCHGLACCNKTTGVLDYLNVPHCEKWIPLCEEWLNQQLG